MGSCPQGVDSQIGFAGVTLLPKNFQTQPQHAFFGDFDESALGVARIRHNDQISGREKFPVVGQQMGQAFLAAGLLVGHEGQADGARRRDPGLNKGPDRKERRDNPMVVVLHAPAIQ